MEDLVMFGNVCADRRVFVTGHTGFKEPWLTQWLLDLPAREALGEPVKAPWSS